MEKTISLLKGMKKYFGSSQPIIQTEIDEALREVENYNPALSEEEKEFIKNLSHEIKTQDNRSTGNPYTYRIQQDVRIMSLDSTQYEYRGIIINEDYYYDIEDAFREVEDWLNGDIEDDKDNVEIYSESELISYLDDFGSDYHFFSWEDETRLCATNLGGSNCFFTEKACEDFIKTNAKDLTNPKSYIVHEYENDEMKQLIEIVHKLAKES